MTQSDPLILYGIPNCTTVKKARAWLAEHDLDAAFHDFRKHGVTAGWLEAVVAQTGWQALVNTRGTTWRALDESQKAAVTDAPAAIALMQAHPSVIKRPVLERDGVFHVGFSIPHYQALFGA